MVPIGPSYPAINFYTGNCDASHAQGLRRLPIRRDMRSLVLTRRRSLLVVLPRCGPGRRGRHHRPARARASTAPSARAARGRRRRARRDARRSSAPSSSARRRRAGRSALAALRADDDVVYAELDRPMHASRAAGRLRTSASLWALREHGPDDLGSRHRRRRHRRASPPGTAARARGVTVAVVDTGINATTGPRRPDRDTGRDRRRPGVDDDHNGYVDDVHGWDFVPATPSRRTATATAPTSPARSPPRARTTSASSASRRRPRSSRCARSATTARAAIERHRRGVRLRRRPRRAGSSTPRSAARTPRRSRTRDRRAPEHALRRRRRQRRAPTPTPTPDAFPCALPEANVVCVGATDNRDQIAYFSNYGDVAVDLFAPGVDIVSTYKSSPTPTRTSSGTSMASPHVAGAAALALAANPGASTAVPALRAALLGRRQAGARRASPSPAGG